MKETDIYELQRTHLPGEPTRIENSISSGIFDVYWSVMGHGNWLENKVRDGNRIKVRGTQYVWATRQLSEGMGNLWFFVMRDADDIPILYPALIILRHCNLSRTDGKGQMVVDIKGVPSRARGWDAIREVLLGA